MSKGVRKKENIKCSQDRAERGLKASFTKNIEFTFLKPTKNV